MLKSGLPPLAGISHNMLLGFGNEYYVPPLLQLEQFSFLSELESPVQKLLFLLFFYKSGCIFHTNLITEIGILFYFVNLT